MSPLRRNAQVVLAVNRFNRLINRNCSGPSDDCLLSTLYYAHSASTLRNISFIVLAGALEPATQALCWG